MQNSQELIEAKKELLEFLLTYEKAFNEAFPESPVMLNADFENQRPKVNYQNGEGWEG